MTAVRAVTAMTAVGAVTAVATVAAMAAVATVAAMTAMRTVRRMRHVLRQQHLLAVRLGAERLGSLRCVESDCGLHRLPRFVTAQEIQRGLPQ